MIVAHWKRIEFLLRLGVGVGIIFFLFKFVPYQELILYTKNANLLILFLSLVVFFLTNLLAVLRWKVVISTLGIKAKFKNLFFTFFSGLFFNLFFPSLIAGDIFRGLSLAERDYQETYDYKKKIAASVIMDRAAGFLALSFLACVSFFLAPSGVKTKSIYLSLGIILLFSFSLLFFIFSRTFFRILTYFLTFFPRWQKKAYGFHNHLYLFRKKQKNFFTIIGISLLIQIMSALSFVVAGIGFGVKANYFLFFVLVPIISIVAALPLTVGGLGTREAAALFFFSQIGIDKPLALGISLMNFVSLSVMGILGGIFYALFHHRWIQSYKEKS